MKATLYECEICGACHEWDWNSDCREQGSRYGSPEEYAEQHGLSVYDVEVRSMTDRVAADRGERY
jgi:hypothetical protein